MKAIDYALEYRENGERRIYHLSIDFVSNYIIREFNKIMQVAYDVQNKWDRISDITTEISSLKMEKPEGYLDKLIRLDSDMSAMTAGILSHDTEGVVNKRFEILQQLLNDNGYKEPFLHDFDFWDKQVDPSQMIELLSLCAWKDIPKKKQ